MNLEENRILFEFNVRRTLRLTFFFVLAGRPAKATERQWGHLLVWNVLSLCAVRNLSEPLPPHFKRTTLSQSSFS